MRLDRFGEALGSAEDRARRSLGSHCGEWSALCVAARPHLKAEREKQGEGGKPGTVRAATRTYRQGGLRRGLYSCEQGKSGGRFSVFCVYLIVRATVDCWRGRVTSLRAYRLHAQVLSSRSRI
eukprot:scaffold298273_cov40-Tisochrysis_lutea.AAC.2